MKFKIIFLFIDIHHVITYCTTRENPKLAALILYTRISNFVDVNYDVVAHGIWCGFIYIGAGSQGLYSSYNRPQA